MRVEKTVQISVAGALTVTVTITGRSYVGVPVTLSASWDTIGVGPFRGTISWGDGTSEDFSTTTKSITRSHSYGAAGSFTATVYVSDEYTASEGSGSASTTIRPALTATLTASPSSGVVPLTVTFTCGASGGFLNYDWVLDFGDGTTPASGTRTAEGTWTVTHTYSKVGLFTAKLTVTDALGATILAEAPLGAGVEIPTILPWLLVAGAGILTAALIVKGKG